MEEKKSLKISVFVFLLLLAIIVIIVMACYIYIERTTFNKEIASLEENITNMQSIIDAQQERINSLSNPDDEIEEEKDTIKILVENHINHSGMPGPNGATDWGTSRFIASDGWVYEYTYDEYNEKNSYPKEEDIEILSKELISKAKKTEDKLTDKELKLVKDYIKNIEGEKEEIEMKEAKSSLEPSIEIADFRVDKNFVMYNYASGEKMPIDSEVEEGTFYESPSITKLLDIVYILY